MQNAPKEWTRRKKRTEREKETIRRQKRKRITQQSVLSAIKRRRQITEAQKRHQINVIMHDNKCWPFVAVTIFDFNCKCDPE